ncbi:MAG: hypothetical protein LAO51_17605 [Acidobacteriia bacterium]|nr:hypothetical protein [Terriglobia bacterium]
MVQVTIDGDTVLFEVEGWDKLWSLRSRLGIPLAHIKGAHPDPDPAMGWFKGLKLAGTDVPYVFKAGTFYQEGGLIFWDVRHPEHALAVDLEHERYRKLVIEVDDPNAEAALINDALAARRA